MLVVINDKENINNVKIITKDHLLDSRFFLYICTVLICGLYVAI